MTRFSSDGICRVHPVLTRGVMLLASAVLARPHVLGAQRAPGSGRIVVTMSVNVSIAPVLTIRAVSPLTLIVPLPDPDDDVAMGPHGNAPLTSGQRAPSVYVGGAVMTEANAAYRVRAQITGPTALTIYARTPDGTFVQLTPLAPVTVALGGPGANQANIVQYRLTIPANTARLVRASVPITVPITYTIEAQ